MTPLIFNSFKPKIVSKNRLHILIFLIFNSFLAICFAQETTKNEVINDTIPKTDSLPKKKEALEAIVRYSADNIRSDIPKRMSYLNHNAKINYQDMTIEADYISVDWDTGNIFARGKLDENGKLTETVKTTQGGKTYETDSFNFNFKDKKAIAYNTRTEESGGVIVADKTKKVSDTVFYFRRGRYTTDEYFIQKKDTIADYYLLAPHIKLLKGKKNSSIITGPIQMYIEKVPTPFVLPFAILPFSDKRSAGILVPSFGEREAVGFYLNGLGYYQPLGEHFDLKILTDIYTKGSWNFRPEVNYKKNYRYSGTFSADIGTVVQGIKGLSDYSKTNNYRISWRHTQDSKANPYFNFSASVDMVSSSTFYNQSLNNNYIFNKNVLNTQQNSSISFTKRFLKLPFTITGSASYSQNLNTGLVNLRLPQLNVAINQFYLLKPKNGGIREGLLENINVNTGLNFSNYVNTKQGELFQKEMWNNMQTGMQIPLSLSTNTNVMKYFTFTLSATANNVLTNKTVSKSYNTATNKVETTRHNNIAGFSTFSTSASLQTTLYGDKNFGDKFLIKAIRHIMMPSLSFTYSPDFGDPKWGYYKNYTDATGAMTPYSIFEGSTYGIPSSGLTQALGISINNNIQMKVRSKSDSTGVKKVKIFESLNISGNYNFAAENFKLSIINISGQTSFFNDKVSLNTSLTLDPYKVTFDHQGIGTRHEKIGGFGIQGFNVQMSIPLSNELFTKKDEKKDEKKYHIKGDIMNENYYFDDDHYSHFEQPWTLNLNANYAYTRNTLSRFGTKVASLGISGNIKLTPFWNIQGSTNYDIVNKQLAYTTLGFSRDQRSFIINFNWVPFGAYKTYDFYIGIKANILQDAIKYKDRSFNTGRTQKF